MKSKEEKERVVPKLRFPEFRGEEGWEEERLGEIGRFLKGKGISKADISTNGITPCIRYGELYTYYKEAITSVKSHTNVPRETLVLSKANDIIIPSSGETPEDIAKASCVLVSDIALGGDLNIIRTKMNGVFFSYYLNNAKKKDISQLAQGISIIHLYSEQLKKLNVNIPKLSEQNKIAECLLYIDEFIATQSEKLESFKTHRKGLLQLLFPAEGEKVPKLRFPEFKDTGEWKLRTLDEFITERTQIAHSDVPLFSLTIEEGIIAKPERYERSFLVKDESNAYKLVCSGDFAYNPMNLRFGAIARHKGQDVSLSKYYNIFYCDDTVDSTFCELYFKSKSMIKHYNDIATGTLIEKRRVHFSDFLKLKILFPKVEEQQKIADCLSSIDELINIQTQKIETLKQHKKGLMQQLFPTPTK